MQTEQAAELAEAIRDQVQKAVVGQDMALDLLLVSLLCNGHALIEGPPGTAKTMLARCFAASLELEFGRIQFTPDLMPGDVLGANLFNFAENKFSLTKGRCLPRCCWRTKSTGPRRRPRRPCCRPCRNDW